MTHAHQRRLRGARFLNAIATTLRHKQMKRSDGSGFKIAHPDVVEFNTICRRLAAQAEREAANFRRRKT